MQTSAKTMLVPSIFKYGNYGEYDVSSLDDEIKVAEYAHIVLRGDEEKTISSYIFPKSDDFDILDIYKKLNNWNVMRDIIPYSSVRQLVDDNGGIFLHNDGRVGSDYNACGLISLFGTKHINTDIYRKFINSRGGTMISEDDLSILATSIGKKIYFLHSSRGNVSVVILGDIKSKEYVSIHSTGSHFERIEWEF